MNYSKIYTNLIDTCRNKKYDGYTEKHHIIPKCMGGDDSDSNLIIMSAREHFIAHMLLYRIHGTKELLYAINMMTIHNSDNRMNNRRYQWIREKFVENHPCKESYVKDKISTSLKEYYSSEEYDTKKQQRFWKYREERYCSCGCGEKFVCYKKDKKQYVSSTHAPKADPHKISVSLKKTLSNLTDDELNARMANSTQKCDNIERGLKISIGKKGKRTEQQKIMGEKYAKMDAGDFERMIEDKPNCVKQRMLSLRERFL